jgi:hypothetical protein
MEIQSSPCLYSTNTSAARCQVGALLRDEVPRDRGGDADNRMTCPACGEDERQDRKTVLRDARLFTLHRECPNGHAGHMPLVIKPGTQAVTCDCEALR